MSEKMPNPNTAPQQYLEDEQHSGFDSDSPINDSYRIGERVSDVIDVNEGIVDTVVEDLDHETGAEKVKHLIAESISVGNDAEGNAVFTQYVMGVTYDGILVSVDERSDMTDDHFIVRVGKVSQLAEGSALSEQKMAYGTANAIRFRDGGTTILKSEFGLIGVSPPMYEELPSLEGKLLFPIGEDGKSISPMINEPETATVTVNNSEHNYPPTSPPLVDELVKGGISNMYRRRRI